MPELCWEDSEDDDDKEDVEDEEGDPIASVDTTGKNMKPCLGDGMLVANIGIPKPPPPPPPVLPLLLAPLNGDGAPLEESGDCCVPRELME